MIDDQERRLARLFHHLGHPLPFSQRAFAPLNETGFMSALCREQ
jgi:hypothetical protein